MEEEKISMNFPVTIYNTLTPYNEVISKGRVRIFYKGLNRNNTYISDEFAEKLLSTLKYSPVCGIYDEQEKDFTDHGESRQIAKAYGVVPENPNIAWEKHLDEDGVEREYACADVLLWTARYKEANEIIGKPQSMELYANSIKGQWKYINGRKCFEFLEGSFIGLTPLGENVEPCFEGAAFYTLTSTLEELVKELKNYNLSNIQKGGKEEMVINFKISDREKFDAIFSLLNPNFNEDGNWEVQYGILDIYDEYVFAINYEDMNYYRISYTKDDEKNEITIGEKEVRFVLDVSESELNTLKSLRALNGETFEKLDEVFSSKDIKISDLEEDNSKKNETIGELNTKISEKDTEIGVLSTEKLNLETEISTLKADKEKLEEFKLGIETKEKESIIDKYSDKLDKEVLETYTNNLKDFSKEDLEKELAFKYIEATPEIFSKESSFNYIPTGESERETLSPAAQLIKKHKNRQKKNNDINGGEE